MVNVFGESVGNDGPVDLQLVKKVVTTVGQYEDYYVEMYWTMLARWMLQVDILQQIN